MQELFENTIINAAQLVRNGELVIIPTETVYGLGANAYSPAAIAKIFEAKGRPRNNPLIIHFPNAESIANCCVLPPYFATLSKAFWPGPLTMVLQLLPNAPIATNALAEGGTIAVRVPAHPIARKLIEHAGIPIAAPSANISGEISPTCVTDLSTELTSKVAAILDGGSCERGLESTVIYLAGEKPVILRHGAIPVEDIAKALGVTSINDNFFIGKDNAPLSPGLLGRHYAPKTQLRLNAINVEEDEALLAFGPHTLTAKRIENLSVTGDLVEAARNLYHMLHLLDNQQCIQIAVMPIPQQGLGIAINDRLRRAAC